jgi:hypothetical protein
VFEQKASLELKHPVVPQQGNATDCALYALEFVECFLENPSQVLQLLEVNSFPTFKVRFLLCCLCKIAVCCVDVAAARGYAYNSFCDSRKATKSQGTF